MNNTVSKAKIVRSRMEKAFAGGDKAQALGSGTGLQCVFTALLPDGSELYFYSDGTAHGLPSGTKVYSRLPHILRQAIEGYVCDLGGFGQSVFMRHVTDEEADELRRLRGRDNFDGVVKSLVGEWSESVEEDDVLILRERANASMERNNCFIIAASAASVVAAANGLIRMFEANPEGSVVARSQALSRLSESLEPLQTQISSLVGRKAREV